MALIGSMIRIEEDAIMYAFTIIMQKKLEGLYLLTMQNHLSLCKVSKYTALQVQR